jgi:hypothetical protein
MTFPTIKANYFSRLHGGVRIAWRTPVKNLARWQDIDAQIWKFIDAWNVAPPPANGTGPADSPSGKGS